MQTEVVEEISRIVNTLPVDKQNEILQQAKNLAKVVPTQTIWEKIRARAENIPDEVWEKMPSDGSENHDHYLYGTPKK